LKWNYTTKPELLTNPQHELKGAYIAKYEHNHMILVRGVTPYRSYLLCGHQ